jgi:hypothetical protein
MRDLGQHLGLGPPAVVRAGIDAVDGDAAGRQVHGQAGGQLMQRGLRRDVGQLLRHGAVVLPRAEHQDPPTGPRVVVLRRERLDQQQRRPGVDRVTGIDLRRGQLFQRLAMAAGVIGHDDVHVPVGVVGRLHHRVRCGRIG